MAIMLGVVVFIIEWFWPWTKDTEELQVGSLSNRLTGIIFYSSLNFQVNNLVHLEVCERHCNEKIKIAMCVHLNKTYL